MGSRRLPHPRALIPLIAIGSLLLGACACAAGRSPETPTPPPDTATPSPTTTPPPTPTPDLVGPPPRDIAEARTALDRLQRTIGACSEQVVARWNVACTTGDIDGDLVDDTAVLLPLSQPAPVGPHPGVAFVNLSTAPGYIALSLPGAADTSILGRAIFVIANRDPSPRPELSFLENLCTATRCASLVRIYTWDGSTWRDIGPADQGITGIDFVSIQGLGTATTILMHSQPTDNRVAGPTRGGTYRYTLQAGRYTLSQTELDPPQYLFHAILDADALFERGRWDEAIASYEAALANPNLRDWRAENDRGNSRDALVTYALFRIAVATAASGRDPNEAIDRVIREGREPLFLNAAEAFRKGYQEQTSVVGGCLEATRYLATTGPGIDTPGHVRRLMDHGYANPQYTYRDICPL